MMPFRDIVCSTIKTTISNSDIVVEISTVERIYIYLGPWGPWEVPGQGTPGLGGGGGPKPGISLAWGPGQGPKNRNIKKPRNIQHDMTAS